MTVNKIYTKCNHVYYEPKTWKEFHELRLEEDREVICKVCNITTNIKHACAGYGCCVPAYSQSGISGYSGYVGVTTKG
jgi:hypothetical protein